MAKFNTTKSKSPNPRKTTNYEGAPAYIQPTPEVHLYVAAATSLLSSKFYEPAPVKPKVVRNRRGYGYGVERDTAAEMKQAVDGIIKLAEKVKSPTFIANLAVYLRNEMYLRSVSNLLVAHLAIRRELDSRIVPLVARRADDPKELAAMYRYLKVGPNSREIPTMPAQLKKGLAEALRFKYGEKGKKPRDAYEFRKYNRGGKEDITFLDLMRLVHPAPVNADQAEVFRMVKEGTLPVIGTWETRISAAGSDPEKKRAAWEALIDEGLPYMAALRNIRNVLQANVSPAHVRKLIDLIKNEEAVRNSMQLPFRFYSAHRELFGAYQRNGLGGQPVNFRGIADALEKAMFYSAGNIPGFDSLRDRRVAIWSDVSGSMTCPVHGMSTVHAMDVATVLGAALSANLEAVTLGVFATDCKTVAPSSQILATAESMLRQNVGGGTDGAKVLRFMSDRKVLADLTVFFTDLQMWTQYDRYSGGGGSSFENEWKRYKREVNPNAKLVLFNLAGYATSPIDVVRPDVLQIAGWSDKIFQVLAALERGENFFARFHEPLGLTVR